MNKESFLIRNSMAPYPDGLSVLILGEKEELSLAQGEKID
jgi:hypothetical protein